LKTLLFFEQREKSDSSRYGEYQTVLSYTRTICKACCSRPEF